MADLIGGRPPEPAPRRTPPVVPPPPPPRAAPDPAPAPPPPALVDPPEDIDPDEVLARDDAALDPALVGGYSDEEIDNQPGGRTPHPSAGVPRPSYDWTAIKRRYVEGVKAEDKHEWPSLDEVAAHFDVHRSTIRQVSSREGWVAARKQWQAQVEAARQAARANALVKDGINLDNAALTSSKLGLQLAEAKLRIIGTKVQEARQTNPSGGGDSIDALEMTRLAQAVDLWHKIGLRAIGDPVAQRVELSGPNGAPLEISAELKRDDPSRLTNVLGVLHAAGLGDLFTPEDAANAAASVPVPPLDRRRSGAGS